MGASPQEHPGIALSEDGQMLASTEFAEGSRTFLWDVSDALKLGELPQLEFATGSNLALSSDNRLAVAGNPIRIWDVDPKSWRDQACTVANRNLSLAEWRQFLGLDLAYQCTCPELPPGEGVAQDACQKEG